ncbi:Uncharacterised protein [Chryseobacterium nakagawai]|uniref:Helix-turn-helix domain-containing protein n=1 Tax=Chryseobacterium nakagawai TaxID=1241982 RepID=A0AAD0YL38_CHRNA|nr:helix-turn-helix domain-containing protein [Chryseobacterium nakagawai]AZA92501.1 helix-turn-helix domain-containing protein [Chryseobacterium nakagawai]VEH19080.1 Uncharacterised protein [Chryseobacterium nakagawai]
MNTRKINYKKIYNDIIDYYKINIDSQTALILNKKTLNSIDIIQLNQMVFNSKIDDRRHRSYDIATIMTILNYQTVNELSNKALASEFNISRNTVTYWKRNRNKYL